MFTELTGIPPPDHAKKADKQITRRAKQTVPALLIKRMESHEKKRKKNVKKTVVKILAEEKCINYV